MIARLQRIRLTGHVSGLTGDVTGLTGDVDQCAITAEDRRRGVEIATLVEGERR